MSYLTASSDDILTLEAMAYTRESEHAAVMAEVDQVSALVQPEFGGRQGLVEDGNAWETTSCCAARGGWLGSGDVNVQRVGGVRRGISGQVRRA